MLSKSVVLLIGEKSKQLNIVNASRGTEPDAHTPRGLPMLDYYARATWANLSLAEHTARWESYVSSGEIGFRCPKVATAFFWYESLGASIRGAKAAADIGAGEDVCRVPVRSLLSDMTVGNTSLRILQESLTAYQKAAAGDVRGPPPGAKRSNKMRRLDERALMTLHVLRETSRPRSPHMPYAALIQTHDVDGVPMLWPDDSPRWRRASPLLRSLAATSRANAEHHFESIVPAAISRAGAVLSEGLECAVRSPRGPPSCSRAELAAVYSRERFLRTYTILAARDWVLPMYGRQRAFLAPVVDMLNYGQVGLRCRFDDKAGAFVLRATAPIKAGSELLFFYGAFCYEASINMYGFAPAGAKPCPASMTRSHGR